MIGDFIIWVRRVIKQHVTCRHDYQSDRIGVITGLFTGKACTKCDKLE
jgi:hypothetical protein